MAIRYRPPPAKVYRAGPWVGLRQNAATATDRQKYAEIIRNLYIRDVDQAPVAVNRPGFLEAGLGGSLHQLGSSGHRTGQLVFSFTKPDATVVNVLIVGGQFYTWANGSDAITETITAANLATATVTLSQSARVHAVAFAGGAVFSDGVNLPWFWDGTAGAGGITKLSNASILYGQPWIYNGRLFGIKGDTTAHRISMIWSEVGAVNTGYEATIGGKTYVNIWDVSQTSRDIFVAGAATNSSMVLLRGRSATRVTGATTDDFQSTANREAVHEQIGTDSLSGMLVYEDTIYFFSNDGRVMRVLLGGTATEIAIGAREYMAQQSTSKFSKVDAVIWDAGAYGEYLLWAIASQASTDQDTILVVNPRSEELAGIWSGFAFQRLGFWVDSSGDRILVHIGGASATASDEGYAYLHGKIAGSSWSDAFHSGSLPVSKTLQTHAMAWDELTEKYWHTIDLTILTADTVSGVGVGIQTPNGVQAMQGTASISSSGARFDVARFDVDTFAADAPERKLAVGVDTCGRWAMVSINHATAGEQFQLQSVVARTVLSTSAPDIA